MSQSASDGKQPTLSPAYHEFPPPIVPSRGFDFHVYYNHTSPEDTEYAKQLHARFAREFPELPVYRLWDRPIGPHPTAMFQLNTFTPHQTGAVFAWLVVNRGPCDVFVHPNTGDEYKDHAERASWIGKPWPLNLEMLKQFLRQRNS